MAKRRILKKNIHYICSELLAECLSLIHYSNADKEDVYNVMANIFSMQNDCICRISHVQPGMKPKVFFAKLKGDMEKCTDEIIEQITGLG